MGTKVCGFAMSDESKHFSFPGPIVKRRGNFDDRLRPENIERFAREMKSNFDKHKVCGLVVGLPLADGDGALSPFALEVIETMSLVANCSNIWEDVNPTLHASEIVTLNQDSILTNDTSFVYTFWDERFTTSTARKIARSRQKSKEKYLQAKDSIAATLILGNFLSCIDRGEI
jgi:RNase H-fold protein (predicted Holliday junction resolvase)